MNTLQLAAMAMLTGTAQANFLAAYQQSAADCASGLADTLTQSCNADHPVGFAKPHFDEFASSCDDFINNFDRTRAGIVIDDTFCDSYNNFNDNVANLLQHFCENADAVGGAEVAKDCGNSLWGWYGQIATKWGNHATDCSQISSVYDKHCHLTDAFSKFHDWFHCDFHWGECHPFHTKSSCSPSTKPLPATTSSKQGPPPPPASSSKVVPPPASSSKVVPPPASSSKVVPPPASSSKVVPPPASSSKVVPPPASSSKVVPPPASSTPAPSSHAPITVSTYTGSSSTYRCKVV